MNFVCRVLTACTHSNQVWVFGNTITLYIEDISPGSVSKTSFFNIGFFHGKSIYLLYFRVRDLIRNTFS